MSEQRPRWRAIKKKFPRVGPERTLKQRRKDEDELIDRIQEARAQRELPRMACNLLEQVVRKGNWETGVLDWSNDVWCLVLGIKPVARHRPRPNGSSRTDRSPFAFRKAVNHLKAAGLVARERLKPRDSEALVPKTEAWKSGIWIVRRLVWDRRSFNEALDRSKRRRAPDPNKAGAHTRSGDRVRTRVQEIGCAHASNKAGATFKDPVNRDPVINVSSSSSSRSQEAVEKRAVSIAPDQTPLASLVRAAAATSGQDSRSVAVAPSRARLSAASPEDMSRDANPTPPLRDEEAGEEDGASGTAAPTPAAITALQSRVDAAIVFEFHRALHRPGAKGAKPTDRDLELVARWRRNGWTLVQLLQAVEGQRRNPKNRDDPTRTSLAFIFATEDRIRGCISSALGRDRNDDWDPRQSLKPRRESPRPEAVQPPEVAWDSAELPPKCDPELASSILEAQQALAKRARVAPVQVAQRGARES